MTDSNLTETIVTTVVLKKAVFSSTLFGSMIIFQDPAYIIIALIGAFVSMGSAHYDLSMLRKMKIKNGEQCEKNIRLELSKAFLIGLLFTMMSFLVFLNGGEKILNYYIGADVLSDVLPSVWMILTLILATGSVSFYGYLQDKIKGIK